MTANLQINLHKLVIPLVAILTFFTFTLSAGATTTLAPSAPTNVTITEGDSQLTVSWTAPTTNSDGSSMSDLSGYNVYVDGVKDNTSLISGTSYTITSLTNGQSYSITVTAVDASSNESVESTAVTGTPVASSTSGGSVFGGDHLTGAMDAVREILSMMTKEPIVYFVMLTILGGSAALLKKIIPRKGR